MFLLCLSGTLRGKANVIAVCGYLDILVIVVRSLKLTDFLTDENIHQIKMRQEKKGKDKRLK